MRVFSVVGNRPQFIKSAPMSVALRDRGIEEIVLHSGQHWDPEMSQVFFDELAIPEPDYRLDLRTSDAGAMTAPIREAVEHERPDWVLVYGDTNTTVAGAHAAGDVPVAHVEAGLRSFDLEMPEERNRIEVDKLSALLLCPDERSAAQLASEGVDGRREVVGDVMADATRLFGPIARERSKVLSELGVQAGGYVLVTIHREANVQPERLQRIVAGLNRLDEPIVFPTHPRTRRVLERARRRAALCVDRPARLPRPAGARVAGARDRDRLGRAAEGGVLVRRAMRDARDRAPSGSTRSKSGRTCSSTTIPTRWPARWRPRASRTHAPELYGDGHAAGRVADALYP